MLVEVFDGVGAIHELAEVVRQALLGLLAHAVSYGDQCGVGWSAPILLVLLAPLCGGALALVLALGLALVLTAAEDNPNHLLAGGVVHGDVEQVTGGMRLQIAKLMDQGLIGCPKEERADDVHVDDIRKGVALL